MNQNYTVSNVNLVGKDFNIIVVKNIEANNEVRNVSLKDDCIEKVFKDEIGVWKIKTNNK